MRLRYLIHRKLSFTNCIKNTRMLRDGEQNTFDTRHDLSKVRYFNFDMYIEKIDAIADTNRNVRQPVKKLRHKMGQAISIFFSRSSASRAAAYAVLRRRQPIVSRKVRRLISHSRACKLHANRPSPYVHS